jgi:Histidine kinase-, DNA gyrase B-, and HSP90-like ATPase
MTELALHILDIVQNSLRAESHCVWIEIVDSEKDNKLEIIIRDDGKGINPDLLPQITDPFVTSRTTRKVGMGLALMRYHAELTGGKMTVESNCPKGTKVKTLFVRRHIDRQPLGDLTGVMKVLLRSSEKVDFFLKYITDFGIYKFSTKEAKEVLEVQDLSSQLLVNQLSEMIFENLKDINAEAT